MVDGDSHGKDNEVCRDVARRKVGPLLFGWGLLGTTKVQAYATVAGPGVLDLVAEEDAGVAKMLHWLAHCGLGGSA